MRIGKFFANCAKNKKIHSSDTRNRYAAAVTPRNRNSATATVTATATAFQNLAALPFSKFLCPSLLQISLPSL